MLGVWSPDPVLATVGPVGLAAAVGTALIIRFDGGMTSSRTLAEIAADGPALAELSPGRRGVAMISSGETDGLDVADIVGRLASRWPAVVLGARADQVPFPVIPAMPMFPGRLMSGPERTHCVWQPVGAVGSAPGPGPILPRLPPRVLRQLLEGRLPRRSRWVAAWRPIWEMPWA